MENKIAFCQRCGVRFLLLFAWFASSLPLGAQSWTNYEERWYDHNYHYYSIPVTLVAIERTHIHPKNIYLRTVISFQGERIFFIASQTTNHFDYGGSRIFLGTDCDSALRKLKDFHSMLLMPDGTRDTLRNDGYTCFLQVKDDPKYGKLLVTRRINDGGRVSFDDHMFGMLEEALINYDEEAVSSFPHKNLINRDEIKDEIKRYKELEQFVIPFKDIRFCYTSEFYDLFRTRIKEYRKDLRQLRR